MLFYSFFKSLVGKDVVVELKNDLSICGTLHSVDQYLNIKLTDISVTDPEKYPAHAFGQELLHPRLRGSLCPAPGRRGGHTAAAGRGAQGGAAAEAVTLPQIRGDPSPNPRGRPKIQGSPTAHFHNPNKCPPPALFSMCVALPVGWGLIFGCF
ncbi:U6 snRNA-associated Sm-like protein LSm2 isoform X1 [Corvus hawaiiensis]|uniref:U6 snRNA-associated Sm-like protein LSm2 isoform X1 n=1 Tax=Corvus hawaiiensis TaxID=134902 RepID=UPI002019BA02|nr:U6 snRNA-associated Sm-like protein LSm2 isoform X1 [Corvus hawaiiensis]